MPTVLVVDDEPDYRFLLRMLLRERDDIEVVEAANGELALQVMQDVVPDVVIADVAMPVMGGVELVRRLREDTRTSHVRVLIWSADPDRDLPVDAIVPKPYGGDALVRQVTRLLEPE